ncbi:TMEM165/GDT1 family protein [Chlorobaculum sp. 24CR]|uniref:TMEM165/GDT1 family protein n=1 Tax=Chlorobaculum sp. 24CR TaxID=2508878 RepID=UPI00100BADB8|nr:TMEM165/GDT1 family protein [Chlorobaculum sp. 24CR]RXK84110.1 TMEM165/GDT1 family protein [Chlorobaculum sp. 24CR]
MDAFWLSFAMIFLAELGDKSQLLALALATCYRPRTVLWGIFWATLAVHVFSAGIGWLMGDLLPTDWITFAAGLSFIIFGFWTLRGDSLDDNDEAGECKVGVNPFWLVFTTFFMAELGDKTMLSTISLATTNPFIPVWIGSTIGMVVSDGLAVLVGRLMGRNLPEKAIRIGASVVFFLFGGWWMYQGGAQFSRPIWGGATLLLIVAALFFFRDLTGKRSSAA